MNEMKKKRIGGYIRVSTEKQVMGYSIEGQITQIEQYCQFNGYELVDIYADRGNSGRFIDFPDIPRSAYISKSS